MSKFYLTTAIDYANSNPHLGTAYEKIGADVVARYRRMLGDDVYFAIGNDEHSQNVRKKAEEMGMDPKAYCDEMAEKFQTTWRGLHVGYDRFIQTTEPIHHQVVREIAQRIHEYRTPKGEAVIYKAPYEGYYCVSCEAFFGEKDLVNGQCPNHKTKPEWIREENYFFRLSAFTPELERLFVANPTFLQPDTRKNEILKVLEMGLEDVSISRANKDWGVKLPFDENAVAYVWFDALINYISALGEIGNASFKKHWPANLHVIGKDITRFHCLIWPAMLIAAKLPVPAQVWAHGFVSIKGEKMSKSRGNVADPQSLSEVHGADALRYHLMREVPWDKDGDFSEERLVLRYNADLANDLGNLLNRTLSMARKYVGDQLTRPKSFSRPAHFNQIDQAFRAYSKKMDHFLISEALGEAWSLVTEANQAIDRMKPWAMAKNPDQKESLVELLFGLCENLRWAGWALRPVMPEKMKELQRALGTGDDEKVSLTEAPALGKVPSFHLGAPSPLFPRLEG